ncbi:MULTISPECIES: phage tail spike protein [Priestia]|uniref:phage tail spike protein n=1 Tax=Priestia TaxID=2800373 RepID=UPI00077C5CE5|nr:phage tail spike protein [Priestia flexa]MED4589416.1 phage tail spike protein [Priestia flexa]
MIHVLNSQSDHIVAFLSYGLEAATHTRNSNLEEVLTFSWPAIDEKAAFILQRNRAVIEDEDGQYREFIIDAAEKDGDVLEVTATASYLDLKKAKAIAPITLTGQTAATATSYVLAGTEWEPGVIEHAGVRKVVFDKHINPYLALQQLASEFGLELVFRVEISGNRIVRRVVDLVTRVGRFKGKEIVFGKDLLGLVRKEKSDEIVTALLCLGPEKEDGTRITTTVEDEEARQRWGRNNQHLWDIYEPESSDQDMTVERLKSLGETALKKRINSVVEYEISQGDLESIPGYEHEQFRFGDTVRIKDLHYKPPLYMEARTISVERDLLDPSEKEHVLGEFIEYTERDVLAEFDDFKKNMRIRIIKQPTPPQGAYNVLWVDTSRPVHVLHTWDGVQWRKVTPTEASEVGAETPQGAQEKADNSRDEAKEYTDGKVVEIGETIEQVQQDVFNRERVIKRQPTEPVNPLYGDLWVDTSDPLQPMYMWNGTEWRALGPTNADEMGAVLKEEYEQKVQEIIADLANKVPNENYSSTVQEIMSSLNGKAGLEYVNGQLSSKVNAGTVYTKTEVDNALNSRVLKTTYETDKTGIVQRLDSSENRLTVNEKEIGLRAKQQALDTVSQRVTSAEQAIVLQDGKIELMVEKETFNNLKGTVESYGTRITQAESNINLKAEKTALTTTNQNVSNALQSITNLQTEIDLAYEQIALRAKQTDFNTLSNQVSSHQAQLTVHANEIASRVTQDQFNALSIGVRNLVLNSTFNKGWDNWTGVSGGFSIVSAEADKPLSKIAKVTASGLSTISIKSAYANTFLAKKGDTITVSMDIKVNDFNQYDEKKPFIFELLDINRNRVEYKDVSLTDMNITSLPNNEWVRVVYVHKVQNSSVVYGRVRLSLFKNGTVFYREIKAEYGNKNTSWTEAPEDVDEKINGLDGRISTAETTISQTATEIKSLAKKSELDTVSGRLDTAESTISQQAAAIAQRVTSSTFTQEITNTKSYADSSAQTKANTAETNAKNHANTKASTAEANAKSYTDGKINTVNTRLTSAESLITQQANEIASRVTKTEFESLSIGGRNIVKGTSNEFKTATFGGWDYYFTDQLLHWSKGDVITGRIYLKPGKYEASIMIHIRYTNGTYNQYRGNVIAAGSEGYSIVTLTIPNRDDISYIQYSIRHSSGSNPSNTVQYKEAKIEKGSRPTDWTPAPEDIDAQINSVSARVSTAESTITQQAGLIAQKVSTTDFNGNTIASKLVQTSSALDLIAQNLNLTGLVTFSTFNSDVQSKITAGTTAKSTLDSKASIWDAKETTSGAQTKADAARNSAIAAAASDASTKASNAEANAKNYASSAVSTVNDWRVSGKTTINGGKIETNTITVRQIAVGDFTNLWPNQNLDPKIGSFGLPAIMNDTHNYYSIPLSSRDHIAHDIPIHMIAGDEFLITADVYRYKGSRSLQAGFWEGKPDGSNTSSPWRMNSWETPAPYQQWTSVAWHHKVTDSTTFQGKPYFQIDQPSSGGDTGYMIQNIKIIRKHTGKMVVNGTISAEKLNVNNLSSISANLGVVTAGELRSVIIRASTFDTLSGSVINIGSGGAGIDLYDGSFRLKQSAGHYYSINNSGQHIFWQGSDPFIRIQKTQDSDSNPAVQGARAQLVFLKDRTAVYARNAANTDYADFAANEFRAIGKYVSIVNGNLESTTGYIAVTAATENTGSTQHIYLRPSGSGSVHVLRNTSFNIDSSSPDYRPIIVQTVGTRSTSLSKTNIREVDFKATSLLKDVDVHEYHTISDVVGGNYFDKKIGFITEMTPALMKFENNIDLYTTLALVWKQNQEQQEEIERLEKEKNDIHDVLGVLIQEIDALKKAVSAA